MRVLKRDNQYEDVSFDKVLRRLSKLSHDLEVDYYEVAKMVCSQIYDGVSTDLLDELAANICSSKIIDNPDYDALAARVSISNHHKKTREKFSDTIELLYKNEGNQLINDRLFDLVNMHKERIDRHIDYERDYLFDYFGFRTLEKTYLMKNDKYPIERPQDMWMRISLAIHGEDIESALETYDAMSLKMFTHATPTLFNYGSKRQQGSSCFLLAMQSDSVEGLYDTLKECVLISKYAGGIGLHCHTVRANGSIIKGTNGKSTGLVPMLRVYNDAARHINQAGKRNGSFAIYLEPWHADIEQFLQLKKNHGNEQERARDLFYGLWVPDLFMQRVKSNGIWSLMSPDTCPGLDDKYDNKTTQELEFTRLYEKYEKEGKYVKQISAQDLWFKILESQIETGTPYMLYKDSVNTKNQQSNLGTIKSSNLCSEIVQYTSPDEIAVCNLASMCLPSFVDKDENGNNYFDFTKLKKYAGIVTRNLNKIIDSNFYPVDKARDSNFKHRPIGIGVQGLADTFLKLNLSYDSSAASVLNKQIFETIYYGSLCSSAELAKRDGPYSSYDGSPASQGILQYDMWQIEPSELHDWKQLKQDIAKYGLRNSLLVAPMPTASTASIMGFTESFEAITSNIYKRKTLAGEFILVNKYLHNDLKKLGIWDEKMKDLIVANDGSIQKIDSIPENIKEKFKTVWEIPMKTIIDQAAERGAFVDQSQSMNLYQESANFSKLTNMHFYSWAKGLKTGMYYLRTKAAASTQKFTIDSKISKANYENESECLHCSA